MGPTEPFETELALTEGERKMLADMETRLADITFLPELDAEKHVQRHEGGLAIALPGNDGRFLEREEYTGNVRSKHDKNAKRVKASFRDLLGSTCVQVTLRNILLDTIQDIRNDVTSNVLQSMVSPQLEDIILSFSENEQNNRDDFGILWKANTKEQAKLELELSFLFQFCYRYASINASKAKSSTRTRKSIHTHHEKSKLNASAKPIKPTETRNNGKGKNKTVYHNRGSRRKSRTNKSSKAQQSQIQALVDRLSQPKTISKQFSTSTRMSLNGTREWK